jgi:Family of unknown function (DUF6326)
MLEPRIVLAGLWVATMLTYLLGDVLRIVAGDMQAGNLSDDIATTPNTLLLIAIIMLIPILLVVLNLLLTYPTLRWVNIIGAIVVFGFNVIGLPYKGAYDNFLIVVSLIFNLMVAWIAWTWQS